MLSAVTLESVRLMREVIGEETVDERRPSSHTGAGESPVTPGLDLCEEREDEETRAGCSQCVATGRCPLGHALEAGRPGQRGGEEQGVTCKTQCWDGPGGWSRFCQETQWAPSLIFNSRQGGAGLSLWKLPQE